jgi:DNA-binding LacI/PurR family transcriptional regulator
MKPVFQRNSITQQVSEHLEAEIRQQHRPGDRLEAERILAKRLGVSLPTVREALGILSEQGLIERRHGSGTYVLDPNANRHVAVLMELDIGHPRTSFFFTRLVQSLRLRLEEQSFKVRLYTGHTAPGTLATGLTCPDFLPDVENNRISAVAAVALPPSPKWVQPLASRGIPLVGGEKAYRFATIMDHESHIHAGVRKLAEAGRTRLAMIGGGGPAQSAALTEAFREFGLQVRPEWVPETAGQPATPGLGWRQLREVWAARPEKPDGLLVMDDLIFQDAAMAILEADIRVPDDLLVVTESNRGSSIHYPFPVIRLENDPEEYAQVVTQLLTSLIRKEPVSEPHVKMPFRVVDTDAIGVLNQIGW